MRSELVAGLGAAVLAFGAVALTAGIGGGSEPRDRGEAAGAPTSATPSSLDAGREVFVRMGCGSCHTLGVAGSRGRTGPNLDEALAGHTRASLVARIMAPEDPRIFSAMPSFATRLNERELDRLVDFLLAARALAAGGG